LRILCVCDQGNSRSPTLASLLRYRGHDTLAVGVHRADQETRQMLADWCDVAIFTDPSQRYAFPSIDDDHAKVWTIADAYPRPFNPDLFKVVRQFIAQEGL
jgi:hypothetical protein